LCKQDETRIPRELGFVLEAMTGGKRVFPENESIFYVFMGKYVKSIGSYKVIYILNTTLEMFK